MESWYLPDLDSEVRLEYYEDGVIAHPSHPDLEDIFGHGNTTAEAIEDLLIVLSETREHLAEEEDKLHPRLARQLAELRKLNLAKRG